MNGRVHVGARYISLAPLAMCIALVASYVVLVVYVRQRNLASAASLVELGVGHMADCKGCKAERDKAGKTPRSLVRLPIEVTQDKAFKRKGLAVQICEYCDGDVLEEALKAHDKRIGST